MQKPAVLALSLALIAAKGVWAAPAAAERFIVTAEGPAAARYPAGRKVADDERFALGPQDRLVLLDRSGTHLLRGPGTFAGVVPRSPEATRRIASIFAPPSSRSGIAAVRGFRMNGDATASIWRVDLGWSGSVCVPRGAAIGFARSPGAAAAFSASTEGSSPSRAEWPAGSSSLPWPTDLPVRDRADYHVTLGERSTTLRLILIDAQDGDPAAVAATLAQHGCSSQLDEVVRKATAVSEDSPESS